MKLLYFWADWNGRSKSQKEVIENYCSKKSIDYSFINIDDNDDVMEDYGIDRIPAMLMLDDYDVPIVTHYGKITTDRLNEIYLKSLD